MFSPPPARHRPPQSDGPEQDASIRQTDTDAALARLSAVQKGYLSDPFVRHLVPRANLQPPRPPLINIGTYVRTKAIDDLVHSFLGLAKRDGTRWQIVSLGAGSDTRYWRLAAGEYKENLSAYIEMDFPEVTIKKAMAIRKSKELSALLGSTDSVKHAQGGSALHSPTYHLLPVDLRRPPEETLSTFLKSPAPTESPLNSSDQGSPLLSPSLPTLLLFECVLVYMSPKASSGLIQWFVDYFSQTPGSTLGAIVYEMFGLNDSFGRVMVENLKARNITLPGAEPYPSKTSLTDRFLSHRFSTSHALTLRSIRRNCIGAAELERTSNLEMLDEIEELELVLDHYAITWGLKVPSGSSHQTSTTDWRSWGLARQT